MSAPLHHPPLQITAMILAGGQGRRMGGCDKALQRFGTSTLLDHVLQRLRLQQAGAFAIRKIAINANRALALHARADCAVWPDLLEHAGYLGPLAGVASGLSHCTGESEFLLCVPCDCPFFPLDLLARFSLAMANDTVDVVSAVTRDTATSALQPQPVFCLMRARLLPHLQRYLAAGGRQFSAWWQELSVQLVEFDDVQAFRNINTRQELETWSPDGTEAC